MAVNPAIAMGVRGIELADPLAQYGKVAAIQGAQQQNALAQLQMRQAEREQEATNALKPANWRGGHQSPTQFAGNRWLWFQVARHREETR